MSHFRSKPLDFNQAWEQLGPGVEQMLTNFEAGLPYKQYMALYTLVHDYCTRFSPIVDKPGNDPAGAKFGGQELYDQLRVVLRNHMKTLIKEGESLMGENLLIFYNKKWTEYCRSATVIHNIFNYLNRHLIKRALEEKRRDVYEVSTTQMIIWRDTLFTEIRNNMTSALLQLIEKDRNGEHVPTSLMKDVIESYALLGLDEADSRRTSTELYAEYFEAPFLKETRRYYQTLASKFLQDNNATAYAKKAEEWLDEEDKRINQYLHHSTRGALIQVCEEELIANFKDILAEEFSSLLQDVREEDLGRIYNLLRRLKETGLAPLRAHLERHVKAVGLAAVEKIAEAAENDPKQYVDALLQTQRQFADLVAKAFRGDSQFVASFDKACREFINRNAVCSKSSSKSPELLARYADSLLKKGTKTPDEAELEDLIKGVMVIFKYVDDKDVFQKFYSKMLAKRLVSASSVSEYSEESMITKLKEACGSEYTSKLQRMFNDIQLSRDLNQAFREHLEAAGLDDLGLDLSVLVLATGAWPLSPPSTPFSIPVDLESSVSKFQRFYTSKYSGRKLTWLFQLSKGEIKANYIKLGKSAYTFQVSTYQMGVLLLYNNADSYTYGELLEHVKLSDDILKQIMAILIKAKVLTGDEDPKPSSTYKLNYGFKSKKIKVNLNMPLKTEQKVEQDETHRTIQEDRKILIQAAIVRIMKMRKTLKHTFLVDEVLRQLQSRFKPAIADIKRCIDMLIEREYITRSEEQKDLFMYVA